MGLIKTGIKYGTLGYIAKKGFDAYGNNHQQQQQQPVNNQQPRENYNSQPPAYTNQSQQTGQRDAAGYLHQNWCNGQCGHQCNGGLVRSGEAVEYYEGNGVQNGMEMKR